MDLTLAIWRAAAADRHAPAPRPFRLPPGAVRAHGPIDDAYPAGLLPLSRAPIVFVRGRPEPLPDLSRCLAIIGARRCTADGKMIARQMAAAAARAGMVVVSGLALGIDAAAHEGALDAGGTTIAVLASAVDEPTPRRNARLAEEIAAGGGWLVSERAPGARVTARAFPVRNRIVAALSGALLVVEAGLPSGTLTTVQRSVALGRPVGAVPGSVLSPASAGANALIAAGAVAVTCTEDAVGLLRLRAASPRDQVEGVELAVLRGIPGAGAPVEDWIAASGAPVGEARAAVLALIARGALLRRGALLVRALR